MAELRRKTDCQAWKFAEMPASASQRFIESPNCSKYLFLRNFGRKIATHFSWNCSSELSSIGRRLEFPPRQPEWQGFRRSRSAIEKCVRPAIWFEVSRTRPRGCKPQIRVRSVQEHLCLTDAIHYLHRVT
ncbi:MAG: hypothetical protein E5W56_05045 [Mesorhizobium sp.]|nr:hypothetical protein EN874_027605 [Mesorhizobium sp. M1D.F.Ca.ET.231.01.1.1]TGP27512.1 hypothetical protein EN877_26890 [Mesorhizobium sp. M1D.F.Ca.ET.234.01.1.1]TGS41547.1 hypothetical protein EN827_25975 [Mesorhizobium sp. M1D.F.Ca.ET.184.01.1.1]TGS59308.1 hypothetical protein EN826_025975 [Mesorhizobium sp. M1D.F.Ca.ET.183.01.1.1]TIT80195.1 MAG: hypothetical protein E5W57_03815 [Mesorhizobium sp.]